MFLFPFTEAGDSPNWSASSDKLGFPTPAVLIENGRVLFDALGAPLLWGLAALGLALIVLPVLRRRTDGFGLLIVALCVAGTHGGLSLYGVHQFRQFIGEIGLIAVLGGVGLGLWAEALALAFARLRVPTGRLQRGAISALVTAIVAGGLLLPQLNSSLANAQRHTLPDRRNALARYMDTSLAPAPYIAEPDNHKTLDGAWGGYAGRNSFHLVEAANLASRPLDVWRQAGAVYAIENYDIWQDLLETPEGQALAQETLLLKSYPPSRRHRGPSMVVLRLYPIQHEVDGRLGTIHLIGYDMDQTTAAPGDLITFTLYWQADAPTDADYAVFNHLVPLDSSVPIVQADGSPLPDERRPTTTWTDADETFISRAFTLTIPDAAPGTYHLLTGFYQRDTGARLTSADGADSVRVTDIVITGE